MNAAFATELSPAILSGEKGESVSLRVPMPVRSCKVTIEDMNGVSDTVDVTAGSLYEAVPLGMAAIRTEEWVGDDTIVHPMF